jgi:hypothetical protein
LSVRGDDKEWISQIVRHEAEDIGAAGLILVSPYKRRLRDAETGDGRIGSSAFPR